jgi:hypothetical protein
LGLVLGGLVLVGGVGGAPKNPIAAQKAAERNAKHQLEMALAPIIRDLHAVKVLLESADHDYKGHRAAAVREIHAAIKHLGGHERGKGPAGNNEPQALSDAQLKTAMQSLATTGTQLSTVPHPRAAAAANALGAAVKELEIALTIR